MAASSLSGRSARASPCPRIEDRATSAPEESKKNGPRSPTEAGPQPPRPAGNAGRRCGSPWPVHSDSPLADHNRVHADTNFQDPEEQGQNLRLPRVVDLGGRLRVIGGVRDAATGGLDAGRNWRPSGLRPDARRDLRHLAVGIRPHALVSVHDSARPTAVP